jgi:chromosome segregation ATPase
MVKKLEEVAEKAAYLKKKSEELMDTNRQLRQRVQMLESAMAQKEEELHTVKSQYEVLKLARTVEGSENENAEELKKKINEYIREIDQCLKLIGTE